MNFIQIINKIDAYSKSLPYVKSTNCGDIYEFLNGNPDIEYATVNIDINQSTRNGNLTSYNVYLYYVDRLAQDKNNWMEIKTTAEYVLNSIINYAAERLGDVNDGWIINYFEQQFADYTAGGWVNFQLEVPNIIGECLIDEYFESEDEAGLEPEIIYPTAVWMTQSQYNALGTYDPAKVYIIYSRTSGQFLFTSIERVYIGSDRQTLGLLGSENADDNETNENEE